MNQSTQSIAHSLANQIKLDLHAATKDGRVSLRTLTTSYALHIALEAIASQLDVDTKQFKQDCGVGQPLAYFI